MSEDKLGDNRGLQPRNQGIQGAKTVQPGLLPVKPFVFGRSWRPPVPLHPDAGHGTSWHFRYGNEAMPLRTHPDPPVSSAPWLRISSGGSNGKMGGFSIKPCSISGGYGRYGFTARWLQPIFKICLSLSLTIPFQNGWKCG